MAPFELWTDPQLHSSLHKRAENIGNRQGRRKTSRPEILQCSCSWARHSCLYNYSVRCEITASCASRSAQEPRQPNSTRSPCRRFAQFRHTQKPMSSVSSLVGCITSSCGGTTDRPKKHHSTFAQLATANVEWRTAFPPAQNSAWWLKHAIRISFQHPGNLCALFRRPVSPSPCRAWRAWRSVHRPKPRVWPARHRIPPASWQRP